MTDRTALLQKTQLERQLVHDAQQIDKLGIEITEDRAQLRDVQAKLATLKSENDDFAHATVIEVSGYIIYWVVVGATALLDTILLAALSRYLTSHHIRTVWLARLAAFAFPLIIIVIEFGLSLYLYAEKQRTGEQGWKYWAMLTIGVAFALAVPAASVSIALKAAATYGEDVPIFAIGVVSLISLIGHLWILLNGERGTLAKGFLVYRSRLANLTTRHDNAQAAHLAAMRAFSSNVIAYAHALKHYHDTFGPYPAGPWSEGTRQLLEEEFHIPSAAQLDVVRGTT